MLCVKHFLDDYLSTINLSSKDLDKVKIEILSNGKPLGNVAVYPVEKFISEMSRFIAKNPDKRLAELDYAVPVSTGEKRSLPREDFCASLVQATILANGGLNLFTDALSVRIMSESGFVVYPPAILKDLQKARIPAVRGTIAVLEKLDSSKIIKLLVYQFSRLPERYVRKGKVISLVCKDVFENRTFIADFGPYTYGSREIENEMGNLPVESINDLILAFMVMTAEIEGKCPFGLCQKETESDLPGTSFLVIAVPTEGQSALSKAR